MRCRQCGQKNREEARYCLRCGARREVLCPTCGILLPGEALFCDQCGQEMRKPLPEGEVLHVGIQSVEKVSSSPDSLTRRSLEGERKQLTVLFADVSGFTAIAEQLDPEEVHALINRCFAIISQEVRRYEGTITQLSGDGVMALFGAPISQEDHALRAVYAAMAILQALRKTEEELKKGNEIGLLVKIGLNSGLVLVGWVGSGLDREYTALGDTVNVASRLQTMADPGSVLISGETQQLVEGFFELESLGELEIRGRKQSAPAYRVVGTRGRKSRLAVAKSRGLTPLVGRKIELELLSDCLEKVKMSQGQVICLVGEAGIGKSRLIHDFRGSLGGEEITWLESGCLSFGREISYLPVLEMIKSYYGLEEIGPPQKMAERIDRTIRELDPGLAWTLPYILHLLSLKVDDEALWGEMEPKLLKLKAHEALRTLVLRKSQAGPLVWVAEDLHWIDASTEEFLASLVEAMAGSAFLLLLTYRPGYSPPWTTKSYSMQIALNRLSPKETAGIAESLIGAQSFSEDLKDFILGRAEGNPFFVEELTRSLIEAGAIARSEGKELWQEGPKEKMRLPRTIQGVIMERIDRLSEDQKRTLQVASVIGQEFSINLLKGVLGSDEREVQRNLQELVGSEFIHQKVYWPDQVFWFRHVLIQEVAYSGLLLQRRKAYHGAVAELLERLYAGKVGERCEELAFHYRLGENFEKALEYWTLAGNKASRIHAVREAISYFQAALRALEALPSSRKRLGQRMDVDMKYSFVLSLAGKYEEALSVLRDAERIAEEVGDRERLMQVCSRMATILFWKGGTWDETSLYQRKAFELAEKLNDIEGMAAGYEGLGLLYTVHDSVRAIDFYRQALEIRKRQGDKGKIAACWRDLGWAHCTAGDWKEAIGCAGKGLELGKELDDLRRMGWSYWVLGLTCGSMGEWEKGIALSQQGVELCRQIGDAYGEAMGHWGLAWSYLESGDWQRAEEAGRAAVFKALDTESSVELFVGYASLTEAYLGQEKLEEALETSQKAWEVAQQLGFRRLKGWSTWLLGAVYSRKGGTERGLAKGYLQESLDLLRESGAKDHEARCLRSLGLFYWSVGELNSARESLAQAVALFEQLGTQGELRRTREDAKRLETK